MAVNAGLANPQACVVDNALYLVHGRDDRFSRAEKLHAAPERSDAAVINALQLFVRLAQAKCAFDMGEIPADLGMDLADDNVPRLHRPRRRKPERVRKWMTVASPQE